MDHLGECREWLVLAQYQRVMNRRTDRKPWNDRARQSFAMRTRDKRPWLWLHALPQLQQPSLSAVGPAIEHPCCNISRHARHQPLDVDSDLIQQWRVAGVTWRDYYTVTVTRFNCRFIITLRYECKVAFTPDVARAPCNVPHNRWANGPSCTWTERDQKWLVINSLNKCHFTQ